MTSGREIVRQHEIDLIASYLKPGSTILEIGAGTGMQAKALALRGFQVSAIDVKTSQYRGSRVFEVQDYDGTHLPFPDAHFDVVFSSNVLEHIVDLATTFAEMRRVLKPNGYCVHAMPTPAWRFYSALAGFVDIPGFVRRSIAGGANFSRALRGVVGRMVSRRHGIRGNSLTELWLFRARSWERLFVRNGFTVVERRPMGLVYSGYHVLGGRLPVQARERAAKTVGSSCMLYVVTPNRSFPGL